MEQALARFGPVADSLSQTIVIIGSRARSLVNFRGPLIRELSGRGYRVVACAPAIDAAIENGLKDLGAISREIPMDRAGLNPLGDLQTVRALRRLFRDEQPSAVFAYTVKPVVYGLGTARACRISRRVAMITGLGRVLSSVDQRGALLRSAIISLYRYALRGSSTVVFQNQDDLETFRTLKLINEDQPIGLVAGSGVDIDHFSPVSRTADHPILLFVGRYLIDKGIREFAAAAQIVRRRIPTAEFRLVGLPETGPAAVSRAEIDAWVEAGHVVDRGWREDIRPELGECTALVLPSYREGTPRVALEAMSMERPVITTDVPGCRETVEDGVNGYLVPRSDPESLAQAIIRLLEDPPCALRMARAGRRLAETRFESRRVAIHTADLITLGIGDPAT